MFFIYFFLFLVFIFFNKGSTDMFPHTIDPHHPGYYMKMVLRRALNNIKVTISNRIISELIFICQQNLVQLCMVPFMILDSFFSVFLTIGYLVSLSSWFPISSTQVVVQFSLTLNPSTVPCTLSVCHYSVLLSI